GRFAATHQREGPEQQLNEAFMGRSGAALYSLTRQAVGRQGASMKRTTLAVIAIIGAALLAGSVSAKEKSIAGTWTMSVEHIGLKLVLAQKQNAVTGTLDWPHGDPIKLSGAIAGDSLTFSGDSSGENFTIHIDSMASLQKDGTLTGTLKAHFV